MKKLNKKGFTLVELLAVIVILAVIMVITIPTVLGSMSSATDSAAQTAIDAIQKYVDDQVELCNAGLGTLAPAADIFISGTCVIDTSKNSTIITNANYSKEISTITFNTTTAASCEKSPATAAQATSGTKDCKINPTDTDNTGYTHEAGTTLKTIKQVTTTANSQFGGSKTITAK